MSSNKHANAAVGFVLPSWWKISQVRMPNPSCAGCGACKWDGGECAYCGRQHPEVGDVMTLKPGLRRELPIRF